MNAFFDAALDFGREFVTLFSEMAPFLLLGFLLAGILHVWVPSKLYVPKISKPTFKSVLWAAVFGVPLPICSCGVIPTSIAIRREGASKGASVSFLISTPATGVDSILATYSLLGLPFAVLRPVAAFVTALFGGALTNCVTRNEADGGEVADVESHDAHNHSEVEVRTLKSRLAETFRYGLVEMVGDVSKWLCIGLLLGSLIAAFVPNDFFIGLREYPLLCMVAVLLLAMPMYTCATGSIPLALALVAKGITPGAALVLLMAGPATSIASMLVVGKAFGKKTLAAYLISIAGGALFFGFVVDTFFMDVFLNAMLPSGAAECHGHVALGVFDYACAAFLAILILYAKFIRKGGHCGCGSCESGCSCSDAHDHCENHCENNGECCCEGHGECHGESHGECHCESHGESHCECHCESHGESSEHCSGHDHADDVKIYKVGGMSCSHCKACVEKAVFRLDGVESAEADVAKKTLRVEGHVDETLLKQAVEEAGFEFLGIA